MSSALGSKKDKSVLRDNKGNILRIIQWGKINEQHEDKERSVLQRWMMLIGSRKLKRRLYTYVPWD